MSLSSKMGRVKIQVFGPHLELGIGASKWRESYLSENLGYRETLFYGSNKDFIGNQILGFSWHTQMLRYAQMSASSINIIICAVSFISPRSPEFTDSFPSSSSLPVRIPST